MVTAQSRLLPDEGKPVNLQILNKTKKTTHLCLITVNLILLYREFAPVATRSVNYSTPQSLDIDLHSFEYDHIMSEAGFYHLMLNIKVI